MIKKLRLQFVFFSMVIVVLVISAAMTAVYLSTERTVENGIQSMMKNVSLDPVKKRGGPGNEPERFRLPFFVLVENKDGTIEIKINSSNFDLSDESVLTELVKLADENQKETVRGKKWGQHEKESDKMENTVPAPPPEKTGVLKEYGLRYSLFSHPEGEKTAVFADISSGNNALKGLKNGCIQVGIGAFVVFFIISVLLSRIITRPVEKAWKQQKQFIADASHELKTPLTVIMTNAEMLQSDDFKAEQRMNSVSAINSMAKQMRGLVESLLNLTRVDSEVKKAFSELNFSKIVEEAVMNFEPIFYEKGLLLECEAESVIKIRGAENQIRQTVDILLDNAQKYCYPGSRTTVKLVRQHNTCRLSVSEPGDEIPAEDMKHLFERFYRADRARSMSESYGLGLSIAEKVIENHGGKIWAESENGYNSFYVQLPVI